MTTTSAPPATRSTTSLEDEEDGEVHSTEEVAAKDVAGPQLSKEVVKTANMVLNQAILDHYHNVSQARARETY